ARFIRIQMAAYITVASQVVVLGAFIGVHGDPQSFFFQAEDGIRDATVTGVQTCALPICPFPVRLLWRLARLPASRWNKPALGQRSEERRVGKECRSRWLRCHLTKRTNMIIVVVMCAMIVVSIGDSIV